MPPPPPPPPELPDDLVGAILLRLPPDDPACLLRASLACKRWRRILADPAFRRRHRELHPAPSIVGFLRIVMGDAPYASRFVPNSPASGIPPARDLPGWLPLDCRHGRALFLTTSPGLGTEVTNDLVVWDPLTNEQHRLPRLSPPPKICDRHFNAAVLCAAAAEGCDHRDCQGGGGGGGLGGLPCGLRLESQHRSVPPKGRARKVFDKCTLVIPYTSFCIPEHGKVTRRSNTNATCIKDPVLSVAAFRVLFAAVYGRTIPHAMQLLRLKWIQLSFGRQIDKVMEGSEQRDNSVALATCENGNALLYLTRFIFCWLVRE
ncbi:hypothetical protein C2845_PM03G23470 [Panicum miliaceum]|uniref:F-box domain-containing protein n=1 Tax=Panicum miliaceum TaxID=4540 RepID=A0A3L6T713_PANMI|nr:hypothetical protein C2845_PM03G23470 [Panicum miliaceum]